MIDLGVGRLPCIATLMEAFREPTTEHGVPECMSTDTANAVKTNPM